ncbi:uncharacterized protein LTR77_001818 [Saxophila tyrrhenica]|uniref:Uncharacterized protein n=1 Tax=Saxophila tyrrhenica TaxID=1690608 RepID=A0AAV9PLS0_9PEZI|nr:hypothetical protein LTR77_001818 [Saxophila tyrrhenica]
MNGRKDGTRRSMLLPAAQPDHPTCFNQHRGVRSTVFEIMNLLILFTVLSSTLFHTTASAQSSQNATTFALLYGYPLLAWQNYYAPIINEVGANTWYHNRNLQTAADREVVKPNVDTLYSNLVYDLPIQNIEITIPDIPADEFKLFSFYDPYGVNYANVGTSGFYKPGKYLIKPYNRGNGNSAVGLTNSTSSRYVGVVNTPNFYGTILVRWGATSSNLPQIHKYQDACSAFLVPTPDAIVGPAAPPLLQSLIPVYNDSALPAPNVLNLLVAFEPPNPPPQLAAAGISAWNHSYTPPPNVDLDLANATALRQALATTILPSTNKALNNNWTLLAPSTLGIYGDDYALRAAVSLSGYLALRAPFAIYPTFNNVSASNPGNAGVIFLEADEAVLLTFSGKPPVDSQAGFWSLTAYGGDLGSYHLVPNERDVYALGDRSNLTYPNGGRVYGGNSTGEEFQILLQPADVPPPANWTSNWLPAPSGGGNVVPQLRFYGAEEPLEEGTYVYPKVEKIGVITGQGVTVPATGAGSSVDVVGGSVVAAVVCVLACVVLLG